MASEPVLSIPQPIHLNLSVVAMSNSLHCVHTDCLIFMVFDSMVFLHGVLQHLWQSWAEKLMAGKDKTGELCSGWVRVSDCRVHSVLRLHLQCDIHPTSTLTIVLFCGLISTKHLLLACKLFKPLEAIVFLKLNALACYAHSGHNFLRKTGFSLV